MNENKEFQINLIGETIIRNSEGIYASKSPEIDVEIFVDKDYVIDALVRNNQIQEDILQYVKAKNEAIQKFHAREIHELAFLLGFDLKTEGKR